MSHGRADNFKFSLGVWIDGHEFEQIGEFKYLGVIISNQNTAEPEIQKRFNSVKWCSYACNWILSSKSLLHKTKIILYKTIVLFYGWEIWRLSKKQ